MSMKISMPDGCGIHVESAGEGDTALVFLHGIMMSGAVFKRQVSALAGAYRVITVDLRGFGQSDKPEGGYAAETFVADVKHVIEHLGLQRPVIAGWSMGGAVAISLAAAHPGLASRFVLIGASPCLIQRPDWPDGVPGAAAEQIGQTLATDYAAGVDGFCRMMFPEPDVDADKEFIRQIMLATPPHVTLSCLQNIGGLDLRPALGAIREPVSVLCGAEDALCPPGASRFMAEKLAGHLAVIPHGGHCVFLTRAEAFNAALRASL